MRTLIRSTTLRVRLVAVLILLVGSVSAIVLQAFAAQGTQPIPNSKPRWLARGQDLGPAAPGTPVQARVYLSPNGGMAALARTALAMSTKGSPSYRQFLAPAQYFQRFGTTDASVSQVSAWLTNSGFRIASVEGHNRYLEVTGDVAAAERAFAAPINTYRHDGMIVQAPAAALTAPSDLAAFVLAVSGVDTTPNLMHPASGKPVAAPAGFRNAPPCSAYYGELTATDQPNFDGHTLPYAPCGYTGPQFRSVYEGSTTLDGTGITVAIVDAYAAPTIVDDATTYASRHGDGGYAAGQLTQVVPRRFSRGGLCGEKDWFGEETLDVEAVHAMAQGANIRYYASASCVDVDFLDVFAKINDDGVAQIVSNSWGSNGEAGSSSVVAAYEQAFLQGAVEGISYLFASGDDGDEVAVTGTAQPDFPASDPYVTAVGGTSTGIGSSLNLLWQSGWGTMKYTLSSDGTSWSSTGTFLYGSGGGLSTLFDKPAYQAGITPGTARGVPDVAMDADITTGMRIGETQAFPDGTYYDEYRVGGTSLSTPLFAGMTALAMQSAGTAIGLLNPTIYSHASAFTDVAAAPPDAGNIRIDYVNEVDATKGTTPSVRTFNEDSSLELGQGWDTVTGMGVPNSGWFSALQ